MTRDFTDHKFEQPDFFDEKRLPQNYRNTDPITSKEAGINIRRSGKANSQKIVLEYLARKYEGLTTKQIEVLAIQNEPESLRLTHSQMARRVKENEIVFYDETKKVDGCHPLSVKN